MTLPLNVVAISFTIVALFCVVDIFITERQVRRWFRFFQGVAFAWTGIVYWISYAGHATIPPADIRLALMVICILSISEIISHWPLGSK